MAPTDLTETLDDESGTGNGAGGGARARSGAKPLVIVESPAKAKTIAGLLGSDYVVESSIGHIRDLPRRADEVPAAYKGEAWSRLGVDVDNGFKPLYVVSAEKKSQVAKLKQLVKQASEVYLASDEDREGESIAWHLLEVLAPRVPVKRMVFHEITRPAIERAVNEWRDLDRRLVDAQEARRILDRLYGYEVSPVLWKKIMPRLSAGRVQSVATRMVVERERARMGFRSAGWWGIDATFTARGDARRAEGTPALVHRLPGGRGRRGPGLGPRLRRHRDPDLARFGGGAGRGRGPVAGRRPGRRALHGEVDDPEAVPPLPGGPVHDLDPAAGGRPQAPVQLQAGHAGRPAPLRGRLDHLHADRLDHPVERGPRRRPGPRPPPSTAPSTCPAQPRRYERKVKNAQEAHEAIRPAGESFRTPDEAARSLSGDEFRLYDLIWKRTVASQMADATGTSAQVRLVGTSAGRRATDRPGRPSSRPRARSSSSPASSGPTSRARTIPRPSWPTARSTCPRWPRATRLSVDDLEPGSHATQPPARYTEASLVKAMEELGVGRPSTYASVIATILDRGYVWKKGTALVPSFTAFAVVGLLERYFADLVDYGFTASMEDDLDAIASGDEESLPWLTRFYFGSRRRQRRRRPPTARRQRERRSTAGPTAGHGRGASGLKREVSTYLGRDRRPRDQLHPHRRRGRRPGHRGPGGPLRALPPARRGPGLGPRGPGPRRAHRRAGRGAARGPVARPGARRGSRDRAAGAGAGRPVRSLRAARRAGGRRPEAPDLVAVRVHVAGHHHLRAGPRPAAHPPGGGHRSRRPARRSWPTTAGSAPI